MIAKELYDLMDLGFEKPVESGSGRKRMIMAILESALKEEYERGREDEKIADSICEEE